MSLLDLIFGRARDTRQFATLVRNLAEACRGDVWNRVRELVFDMDISEARGYIRARALAPVRVRAAAIEVGQSELGDAMRQGLARTATDRVVQMILCDLVSGSPVARRAAA